MKKIFTLTLTLLILSSAAFSQSFFTRISFKTPLFSFNMGHRYVETYSFTQYQRDNQVARIKAEYNQKVNAVMNLNIGAGKKVELIQQLERGKANQIQAINDRFFDARNKYNYMHYDRNYNWIR